MTTIDWLIVAGYGVAVLLLGLLASGRSDDDTDYFLAGRKSGWVPVAASTWATKLSALTFIGVPGAAMAGNFAYVQLWFGSFLAAYLIAAIFLPRFYQFRVATVYEYLGHRIGGRTRISGTLVFIASRCLASAVRLAGCAIAVSVFFDLTLVQSIVLISAVATIYVLSGGLRAVIWTDTLQLVLFLAGAAVAIIFVGMKLPGGFAQIIETGSAAQKFDIFNFRFDIADPTTFWTGNLFAFVLGLATGGTDQDIAQRALSCPDARTAKTAVVTAGAADLISTFLFLTAGVAVFAFYDAFPQPAVDGLIAEKRFDYVFPHFIRNEMPVGLRGLLIAALFAAAMSSLDSALNGLASSAHYDLKIGQKLGSGGVLSGPQILVVGFAIILGAIAVWFGSQPSILWFGLEVMGYTYGGLLGLFLLAFFASSRADDTACAIAVLTSIPVVVLLTKIGIGALLIPWPWAVVIGTAWTVGAALALSTAVRRPGLE